MLRLYRPRLLRGVAFFVGGFFPFALAFRAIGSLFEADLGLVVSLEVEDLATLKA